MIKSLFTIYDKVTNLYSNPISDINREAFKKNTEIMLDTLTYDIYIQAIKDKEVYLIGEFNEETGKVTILDPYMKFMVLEDYDLRIKNNQAMLEKQKKEQKKQQKEFDKLTQKGKKDKW